MKQRMGISPVLVEMVFVLLFFSLSLAVLAQFFGATVKLSRQSREDSAALETLTSSMESLLADPASLSLGGTQISVTEYFTVCSEITPSVQEGGVYYTVDSAISNGNNETLLTLSGARFVPEEVSP